MSRGEILSLYRQDFSKYTPHTDARCLNAVLSSAARLVGGQVKYTHLAEGYSPPTIKKAFDLLCLARLIRRVPSVSPARLPFEASASSKRFKSIMVDIGLMQHLSGMPVDVEFGRRDLLDIYRGALAEQFIGQELLAAREELYYWAREAKSSSAEVDFLTLIDGAITPVEVKSGSAGRLRSLHLFLEEHPDAPSGLVFSCAPQGSVPSQKLTFLSLYQVYGTATTGLPQPEQL